MDVYRLFARLPRLRPLAFDAELRRFPNGRANYCCCYLMAEGERIEAERWLRRDLSLRLPDLDILSFLRYNDPLRTP